MTYTVTTTMVEMECGECGIPFMVPHWWQQERLNTKLGWTCPNGHGRTYKESRVDKLQREVDDERRRRKALSDLLMQEERSHSATRGHLTRQKRRAANGVCPCCNRTFKQLARHMKSQHPGFVKETTTT